MMANRLIVSPIVTVHVQKASSSGRSPRQNARNLVITASVAWHVPVADFRHWDPNLKGPRGTAKILPWTFPT